MTGEATLDFAWTVWTELGVPGPHRRHADTILDPEPLLIHTPWMARGDPRLLDLVFAWALRNAAWISASRLKALLRLTPDDIRRHADPFFAALAVAGVPWPHVGPPGPRPDRGRPGMAVPLDRPSLWRLRLRALVGVGGRADVLAGLVARPSWTRIASLTELGLAKRNTATHLEALVAAGIVVERKAGNAHEFRLHDPEALGTLTGLPAHAVFPDWAAVLTWLHTADALGAAAGPASMRVAAAKAQIALAPLALDLGIELPADPEGVVRAVRAGARAIADGGAFAIGATRVRP